MAPILQRTSMCAILLLCALGDRVIAQQVIQGDMKVSGTLSARAIAVSGGTVLTTKDIYLTAYSHLQQLFSKREG